MSRTFALRDALEPIADALRWLVAVPERQRPFVVVECSVTGRFVQFATKDGELWIDLPKSQRDRTKTAKARSMEILMNDPRVSGSMWSETSTRATCDPALGADLAVRVFRAVHDLPDEAALRIERSPQPN